MNFASRQRKFAGKKGKQGGLTEKFADTIMIITSQETKKRAKEAFCRQKTQEAYMAKEMRMARPCRLCSR
jgi:hypothetical protein